MELIDKRFLYSSTQNIGFGGQSIVYRGLDLTTNEQVAIKEIELQNTLFYTNYHREVDSLKILRNEQQTPYIVKSLYDTIRSKRENERNDKGYIIMEFVEGCSMETFLSDTGCVEEETAVRWLKQLVKAMCQLKCIDIIHRDLKPANVMVVGSSKQSDLKVIDFGTSRRGPGFTSIGTDVYMAPEIIDRRYHEEKVDVWGLGVLFYVMLTNDTNKLIIDLVPNIPKHEQISPESKLLLQSMLAISSDMRISLEELLTVLNIRFDPVSDCREPITSYYDHFIMKTVRAIKILLTDLPNVYLSELVKKPAFGRILWPHMRVEQKEYCYFVFKDYEIQSLDEVMRSEVCLYEGVAKIVVGPLLEGLKDLHNRGLEMSEISPKNIVVKNKSFQEAWFKDFTKVRAAGSTNPSLEAMGRLFAYLVTGQSRVLLKSVPSFIKWLQSCTAWLSPQCINFACAMLENSLSLSELLAHEYLQSLTAISETFSFQAVRCDVSEFLQVGQRLAKALFVRKETYCYFCVLQILLECVNSLVTLKMESMEEMRKVLQQEKDQLGAWLRTYAHNKIAQLQQPEEYIAQHCIIILKRKPKDTLLTESIALMRFLCKTRFFNKTSFADQLRYNALFNSLNSLSR